MKSFEEFSDIIDIIDMRIINNISITSDNHLQKFIEDNIGILDENIIDFIGNKIHSGKDLYYNLVDKSAELIMKDFLPLYLNIQNTQKRKRDESEIKSIESIC